MDDERLRHQLWEWGVSRETFDRLLAAMLDEQHAKRLTSDEVECDADAVLARFGIDFVTGWDLKAFVAILSAPGAHEEVCDEATECEFMNRGLRVQVLGALRAHAVVTNRLAAKV